MKKYEFTDEQIAELESAHKAAQDPQQALRLRILCLRAHGGTYGDICRQTGISVSAAEGIIRKYKAGGIEAVLVMRAGKRQFTAEQISEVKAAYDAAADKWVRRHLEAVYFYTQGKTYAEISRTTGFGQTTVIRLLQEYRENGLDAMTERLVKAFRRRTDCQPIFTPEQVAELGNARQTAASPKTIRRLEALLQLAEGRTFEEAAAATGYSTSNIYWLKREYLKGGTVSIFRMEHRKKQPFIAHKHKFTPEQRVEIETARKTVADKQTKIRLEMLWLRAKGKSMPEISAATGYSINTIVCVIRQYQEGGLDAIAPKRAKK